MIFLWNTGTCPLDFLVLVKGPTGECLTIGSTFRRGHCITGRHGRSVSSMATQGATTRFSAMTRHPVPQFGPWPRNESCRGHAGPSRALVVFRPIRLGAPLGATPPNKLYAIFSGPCACLHAITQFQSNPSWVVPRACQLRLGLTFDTHEATCHIKHQLLHRHGSRSGRLSLRLGLCVFTLGPSTLLGVSMASRHVHSPSCSLESRHAPLGAYWFCVR